jgi:pimeloyl-ACP methyl ester carboxylesterase
MITDPHTTKYLTLSNRKIPIWVYGNPKNEPIFFIHGYLRGFSDYIGDLPIRYLMKNYFIVAFDLPGFGFSKNINIDNLEFISKIHNEILKNKKVTLFGLSYGGLVSLKYSLSEGERVNSMIIAGMPLYSGLFSFEKIFLYPKYKKLLKEFSFLNKSNLSQINKPILLYYNTSDLVANVIMGKNINKLLPTSRLFIANGQNHKWLLHKINEILSEI